MYVPNDTSRWGRGGRGGRGDGEKGDKYECLIKMYDGMK